MLQMLSLQHVFILVILIFHHGPTLLSLPSAQMPLLSSSEKKEKRKKEDVRMLK